MNSSRFWLSAKATVEGSGFEKANANLHPSDILRLRYLLGYGCWMQLGLDSSGLGLGISFCHIFSEPRVSTENCKLSPEPGLGAESPISEWV